jgi:hypothetical protein
MDGAEESPAWWRRLDGGSSPEEGGNGASMAKLDGFFVLWGWCDVGGSHGWVSQHVVAAQLVHDGRTESSTSGDAASSLQWADGVVTGSNRCGDHFSSSAWRRWSSGSIVAAQQWKGAEARVC